MGASILSVVAGYLAMAAIVMIGTAIAAAAMIPGGIAGAREMEGTPPHAYLYANLAASFVAALLGGWVAARLAPRNSMLHSAALAMLLLAMSVLSFRSQAARQPRWYPITIALIGMTGVMAGGFWETLKAIPS